MKTILEESRKVLADKNNVKESNYEIVPKVNEDCMFFRGFSRNGFPMCNCSSVLEYYNASERCSMILYSCEKCPGCHYQKVTSTEKEVAKQNNKPKLDKQELINKVTFYVNNGKSYRESCRLANVPYGTFSFWMIRANKKLYKSPSCTDQQKINNV